MRNDIYGAAPASPETELKKLGAGQEENEKRPEFSGAGQEEIAAGRKFPGAGQEENGKRPEFSGAEGKSPAAAKKRRGGDPSRAMEVKNLFFSYGKNNVLNGADLVIEKGKITTIMGANGCGKSTLFNLMTKNLEPRKGKIFLKGKNIELLSLKEFARQVAIVQQYNTVNDDTTVEELVAFGRTPHRKVMQGLGEEDDRIIEWAMKVTGISEYRNREVSRLSGGQRQRVWIAMALSQGTQILFLDEPTTYLDIRYQIEILNLVNKLNKEFGITIIMVLHDINQAIHYSDVVIGIRDGKTMVSGDPEEVIDAAAIRGLYDIDLTVTKICGRKYVLCDSARDRENGPPREEDIEVLED